MSYFKNREQDTITEAAFLAMKLGIPSLWLKKPKENQNQASKNPNPFPRRGNITFRE